MQTQRLQIMYPNHSSKYLLNGSFSSSEARKNKRVLKVPKGTSDYQATWIVDEDENEEVNEQSSEEEEDDEVMDDAMEEEDEDICSQVLFCFISKLDMT